MGRPCREGEGVVELEEEGVRQAGQLRGIQLGPAAGGGPQTATKKQEFVADSWEEGFDAAGSGGTLSKICTPLPTHPTLFSTAHIHRLRFKKNYFGICGIQLGPAAGGDLQMATKNQEFVADSSEEGCESAGAVFFK